MKENQKSIGTKIILNDQVKLNYENMTVSERRYWKKFEKRAKKVIEDLFKTRNIEKNEKPS